MKKVLLMGLALCLGMGVIAQSLKLNDQFRKQVMKYVAPQRYSVEPVGAKTAIFNPAPVAQEPVSGPQAVSIIDIGVGPNAIGLSGGGRTYLWADNNLNTVTFAHRMDASAGYGGSRIAMDVNKNGGVNGATSDLTWWNNVQVYNPTGAAGTSGYPQAAGRYPQGGIYNPVGNTNPNNAYFTYFIPTLDNSNGTSNWGGLGYGVRRLDTVPSYSQHNVTDHGSYYHLIPDAFTINKNGDFWSIESPLLNGLYASYNDSMMIYHGTWNAANHDYDFSETLMPWHTDYHFIDFKVAFSPDGNTGYMSVLGHDDFTFAPDSAFYPILYKTVNAGATWTGPIRVKLYGANGISAVKQYLSDSLINALYTTPPSTRDSILFTTAWNHDLVVDNNGNPHIGVVIGPGGGAWDIIKARDYIAMFDIYSPDGGTTWNGTYLDSLKNFNGDFTGQSTLTEYNRPQVSRTMDGTKLFFSWLDTETPGTTTNTEPNIYCKGYDMVTHRTTNKTFSVTKFTPAYSVAYMACASEFVFNNPGNTTWTIPFAYQAMNPISVESAVQYKYISGFQITAADFLGIGVPTIQGTINSVSQNYPNPASGSTMIEVQLGKPADLGIDVTNLLGQKVLSMPAKSMGAGTHDIRIDCSSLRAGVYFYTVTAAKEKTTKKMIVR